MYRYISYRSNSVGYFFVKNFYFEKTYLLTRPNLDGFYKLNLKKKKYYAIFVENK